MNIFKIKNNSKINDERVIEQKRKIGSEACSIMLYTLLFSIIIQSYFMGADFKTYAAEFYIVFGTSFYIIIRSLIIGSDVFSNEKNGMIKVITSSLTIALTITIINMLKDYYENGSIIFDTIPNTILVYGITFISGFIAPFILCSLLYYFNKKRQDNINKKLDK